jgi:hypothetical protein
MLLKPRHTYPCEQHAYALARQCFFSMFPLGSKNRVLQSGSRCRITTMGSALRCASAIQAGSFGLRGTVAILSQFAEFNHPCSTQILLRDTCSVANGSWNPVVCTITAHLQGWPNACVCNFNCSLAKTNFVKFPAQREQDEGRVLFQNTFPQFGVWKVHVPVLTKVPSAVPNLRANFWFASPWLELKFQQEYYASLATGEMTAKHGYGKE